MNDLRFIIVNSNLQHAQLLAHELQRRVSFNVYQDTVEKNIWKLMQGGKDDLFVYDRCGRLSYYIPYPLSIMNEDDSLVPSAILATYYRSPCGVTCAKNSTTLEEFLNNQIANQNIDSEQTETYQNFTTSDDLNFMDKNDLNGTSTVQVDESPNNAVNTSEPNSLEDFDYQFYNDTMDDFETSRNETKHNTNFFNTLYRLFFNEYTSDVQLVEDKIDTISSNESTTEFVETTANSISINETDSNSTQISTLETLTDHKRSKPKPNRCAEADTLVCRNWSKKRLLRANNCCSSATNDDYQQRVCRNFGRKRCKKLQAVLKCCIKTSYVESTTENPSFDTTGTKTPCPNSTTSDVVQSSADVICCKVTPFGRVCYVSETSTCEPEEFVYDETENAPSEGKT